MTGISDSCDSCVWFDWDAEDLACAAFPGGIPEDNVAGAPHTEPREGGAVPEVNANRIRHGPGRCLQAEGQHSLLCPGPV